MRYFIKENDLIDPDQLCRRMLPRVLHKQKLTENEPAFRIVVCMETSKFRMFTKASKACITHLIDVIGYLTVLLFLCPNIPCGGFY